jgi:hypothetical protein
MNKLTHFAVYTDNIERAATFYQAVFNWQINSLGQPGFMQIKHIDDPGKPIGALQDRMYSPLRDKVNGFECSIEVPDIAQTAKVVEQAGGKIVMPITEIPYVGKLFKFTDTEGNLLCAIQYMTHQ